MEEIFGPVVTLQSFQDEAEALALANDSRMGLAGFVFTRHLARGMALSGAATLRSIRGRRTTEIEPGIAHEVVHRDDLVVLV